MSAIKQLIDFGQSPWNDNLTRALATGGLRDLIAEHGMRGVTANPTIFEKAMAQGNDYDAQIRSVAAVGASPIDAYWDLVTTDIAHAADLLRPTFDELDGADGFVSGDVSPRPAAAQRARVRAVAPERAPGGRVRRLRFGRGVARPRARHRRHDLAGEGALGP